MKWSERIRLKREIDEYVIKNRIDGVWKLRSHALKLGRQDWLEVLKYRSMCYELHEFMSSARRCGWTFHNPETGEIYE